MSGSSATHLQDVTLLAIKFKPQYMDIKKTGVLVFRTPALIVFHPFYQSPNVLPSFMSKVLTHVASGSTCGNGGCGFMEVGFAPPVPPIIK